MISDTLASTCAYVDSINRRELRQQEDSSSGTNRRLQTVSCSSSLNLDSDIFSSVDIGSVSTPGETSYSDYGVWNIKGNGYISLASDKFHYTYYHHPSNGFIDARIFVRSFTGTQSDARAGLMIRKRLTQGSGHYSIVVLGTNKIQEVRRWKNGEGTSVSTLSPSIGNEGVWLRITKAADAPELHSYYSFESNPVEADWVTISSTQTFSEQIGDTSEVASVGDFHVGVAVAGREGDVLKGESW